MEPIKFKTVSFRTGTYVYVEEQTDSAAFYIVRQGSLIEESPLNNLTQESNLIIKTGDFFGVLDCMSRRARLSSIRALEDTVLIVVRFDQFETLITQMAPVAIKIIRYFSQRLRKYNTTLAQLTQGSTSKIESNTLTSLIKLGEYYQSLGQNNIAGYAFSNFIKNYPNDSSVLEVQNYLKILNYDEKSHLPIQQGIQETYEAGNPIFLEYEQGADLYIILEGFVKITKFTNNQIVLLAMLKEKDIFGEMAILENSPRSASAIAVTKVTLLRINKQNFELYIRTHPEIARRIIQLLSDRIWLIYKRLANQLIIDPITKIYDALQTLLLNNRVPIKKGLAYSFEMSPTDIIQFIGLDPIIGKKYIDYIIANDSALSVENNKLMSKDVYNIRSAIALSNRHQHRSTIKNQ
ncbi:MAG: cyclic nucleotide-binding domain-containing protein [Spirochaetota bacterium]|nr:cyclic nucleotide-binding domain-containing protein [Spirochaetota bacterium]